MIMTVGILIIYNGARVMVLLRQAQSSYGATERAGTAACDHEYVLLFDKFCGALALRLLGIRDSLGALPSLLRTEAGPSVYQGRRMNGTVTRYTQAGWLAGQSKKKMNRGSPKDIE
jgi:hypothetical protein